METDFSHQPVLLHEVLEALNVKQNGVYVDATFGRGGHTSFILNDLGPAGQVIAFDQDPEAIAYGRDKFADDSRIEFEHCNFSEMGNVIVKRGLEHCIDGVLMDLGVSSPQLDDAERGFSFMKSGPLDMRMNTEQGESAMQWLARVEARDLIWVLKRYGEEKFGKRIATAIIEARAEQPIEDTATLSRIISDAIPVKEKHKHPATRSFQAIRMYINQELPSVESGLQAAASMLAVGGRLAVISFHSLEDRMVKRFMRDISSRPKLPPGLPIMDKDEVPPFKLVGKSWVAGEQELATNRRSRSARLRVLERVR